jgi:hypothetical protein
MKNISETAKTILSSPFLGLAVAGLALALALVSAAGIGARSFEFTQRSQITVKGFAAKPLLSDLAIWEGVVSTRHRDLTAAYKKLEADREAVRAFLDAAKVPTENVDFSAVRTQILRKKVGYNETNEIEGYQLEQSYRVRSEDVHLIEKIASDSTQLLKRGIEVASKAPNFYYSKLEELKIEMLAQATRDARTRAETLATNGGSRLGDMRSAQQGVFQITPEHSVEVSGYGENDTSSLKKVIRAIVTVEYGLH